MADKPWFVNQIVDIFSRCIWIRIIKLELLRANWTLWKFSMAGLLANPFMGISIYSSIKIATTLFFMPPFKRQKVPTYAFFFVSLFYMHVPNRYMNRKNGNCVLFFWEREIYHIKTKGKCEQDNKSLPSQVFIFITQLDFSNPMLK